MRVPLIAALAMMSAAVFANDKLTLDNNVTVELVTDDAGNYLGLGRISIGGVRVCAPRPPMRPLMELADGRTHAGARIAEVREGDPTVVIIRLAATGADVTDELRLLLKPAAAEIAGRSYAGFAYRYEMNCPGAAVTRVFDITHWELGGRSDRLYLVPPHRLTSEDPLSVRRRPEFLRTPCFYFQGGRRGCLVVAYDFDEAAPLIYTEMNKFAGRGPTQFVDEIHMAASGRPHTPWRQVLLCPKRGLEGLQFADEEALCEDYFTGRVRAHFGIPPEPVRRLCIRASEGVRPGSITESYDDVAKLLPQLAEMGFERVWPCSIWDNTGAYRDPPRPNLSILSMNISPHGGGEEGLKRLCRAAEAAGMGVYSWAPTGQLVTDSSFWESNPDWFPKKKNGDRYAYGGGALTWTDLNSGYYDYAMQGLRHAREIGVSGLWFDSFRSVASVINYADPQHPTFNIIPAFRRMKTLLEDLDYENIYLESEGPAGIDGYPTAYLDTGGYTFYRSGKFYYHIRPTETNWYFRMLANYATPLLAWKYSLRTYVGCSLSDHPQQMQRVKYANLAFQATREHMHRRTLLRAGDDPWRCIGTRWDSKDGRTTVYWPYEDMKVRLSDGRRAREVVNGEAVAAEGELTVLRGERVYLVR
ncbi:MAG: hypothetical protein J7M38_11790 [Armatimonadetes bacterium]|nr:hypothetical protein [Armatimonadota bacterium]